MGSESPWQVVLGFNYGTFVTHEQGSFLVFRINDLMFTIFKTG